MTLGINGNKLNFHCVKYGFTSIVFQILKKKKTEIIVLIMIEVAK